MATAQVQARWRAKDDKLLVQTRLEPATVARLDRLAQRRGAAGRGEIIDRLVLAQDPDPLRLVSDAARLLRAYFLATGETTVRALSANGLADIEVTYTPRALAR